MEIATALFAMVMALAGLFMGLLGIAFAVAGFAFWIWMIVDCATNEPSEGNDKIIWLLVIIFTHLIGALIYFLVRRPQRKALLGK